MIEAASPSAPLARFSAPIEALHAIDAETAGALIAASADVALVIDNQGIIVDLAFSDPDLANTFGREWVNRRFLHVVTIESRPKIEDLLRDAAYRTPTRWRQVNHSTEQGADIPIRYCAIRFGADRRVLAVGKDLRSLAALQLRLAEAQQSMEREYARIRSAERRYRLLFQLASEAVLIVDSTNDRIIEANPAASTLIGIETKKLQGHAFGQLFTDSSRQAVQSFLSAARVAARVDKVHVQLGRDQTAVLLTGSLYRQEGAAHLLVLLSRLGDAVATSSEEASVLRLVEAMPEAFVVTGADRRILFANSAFLDLAQTANVLQVQGEPIERWIGRPSVEIDVLFANLRAHGSVSQFSTVVRGEFGGSEDVEIVAVAIGAPEPCFGLTIRTAGWRVGREALGGRELPRSVEQFKDLVGRAPLKSLVRETTDLIERLCIQAALELTRDNRASAAEMLGLSRQALYAKLRRYGLGDLDSAEDSN